MSICSNQLHLSPDNVICNFSLTSISKVTLLSASTRMNEYEFVLLQFVTGVSGLASPHNGMSVRCSQSLSLDDFE